MSKRFLVKFRTDIKVDFGSWVEGNRYVSTRMSVIGTNLEHIVMVGKEAGVNGIRVVGVLSPHDIVLKLMNLSFHYNGDGIQGRHITTYYLKDEVVIEGEYDEEKHGPIQT